MTAPRPTEPKRTRLALGWTQTKLAQELGVTLRQAQNWESGATPFPKAAAIALHHLSRCAKAPPAE